MRIAIVGAGRIGGNAARLWSRAGHDVAICLSRHPARAADLGDHVGAASPAHAVAGADVVMLAVPWAAIDEALEEAVSLAGKVVLSDEPGPEDDGWGRRRRLRPAPPNETSPHYPRADPAEVAAPVVADVLTTTAAARWPRTPPIDA